MDDIDISRMSLPEEFLNYYLEVMQIFSYSLASLICIYVCYFRLLHKSHHFLNRIRRRDSILRPFIEDHDNFGAKNIELSIGMESFQWPGQFGQISIKPKYYSPRHECGRQIPIAIVFL